MDVETVDLRKVKQAMEEAVREADIAVRASLPDLEEVEKIRETFDQSLGRVAKMIKQIPTPVCRCDN